MINKKFFVSGMSMLPFLKEKSLIELRYTKDVKLGNIIVFKRKKYVIHRIVILNKKMITTKGDNNSFFDKPIRPFKVIAKIIKIDNKDINKYNNKLIARISYLQGKINSKNRLINKLFNKIILILG